MLTTLEQIEAKLEKSLERDFVKLWQANLDPSTVAHQLARALETAASSRITQRARRSVPYSYEVRLHPTDAVAIEKLLPDFSDRLSRDLLRVARELNFIMLSPPTVKLIPDNQVSKNDLRVSTNISTDNSNATRQLTSPTIIHKDDDPSASRPYLIIHGHREVRLTQPIITLGRGLENDIILDHHGISRNHAQIRLRKHQWMLFDLNSSSGTFVNGDRITEAALRTGDVISLAASKLIFCEDHGDTYLESRAQQQISGQTIPLSEKG